MRSQCIIVILRRTTPSMSIVQTKNIVFEILIRIAGLTPVENRTSLPDGKIRWWIRVAPSMSTAYRRLLLRFVRMVEPIVCILGVVWLVSYD